MLWPSIVGRPKALVALACGSRSISRILAPCAARQAASRFEGLFLSPRQARALLADPALQVHDSPGAFLACNYDPAKALCHPDREAGSTAGHPALDRCDPACEPPPSHATSAAHSMLSSVPGRANWIRMGPGFRARRESLRDIPPRLRSEVAAFRCLAPFSLTRTTGIPSK